jgi:hypothetical protein
MLERAEELALHALLKAVDEAQLQKDGERVVDLIQAIYALLDGDGDQPAEPVWASGPAGRDASGNERRVFLPGRSTRSDGARRRRQKSRGTV